jgi:hypothetical protein
MSVAVANTTPSSSDNGFASDVAVAVGLGWHIAETFSGQPGGGSRSWSADAGARGDGLPGLSRLNADELHALGCEQLAAGLYRLKPVIERSSS